VSEVAVTPTSDPFAFLVHADGMFEYLSPKPRKITPPPIETRREYALPNFKQTPLYRAFRLYVAQIALGLIR